MAKLPKDSDGKYICLDMIASDNFKQKLWRQFLWKKVEISDGMEAGYLGCQLQIYIRPCQNIEDHISTGCSVVL